VYLVVEVLITVVKGLVHPKMTILSVFTHPHVVPNLYVFICSAEHKRRYLEECFNQTDLIPHWGNEICLIKTFVLDLFD